jgi:hypothetical protein
MPKYLDIDPPQVTKAKAAIRRAERLDRFACAALAAFGGLEYDCFEDRASDAFDLAESMLEESERRRANAL